jgi:hypothetical protein
MGGSPLNPKARKVGKRGPSVKEALTKEVRRARDAAVETGEVQKIRLGNATITIRDTDLINDVVNQVLRDHGLA